MARIDIDISAVERLTGYARQALPHESCGILIGISSAGSGSSSTSVVKAVPTENASAADRCREFAISPQRLLLEYDRACRRGLDIVGFYHSHPCSPAIPSARDVEAAWPDLSYLILGMGSRSAVTLRSWRLASQPGRFDEELVEIVDKGRAVP